MADTKVTELDENTTPLTTDVLYIIDNPGGTPASQKITLANLQKATLDYAVCNGRLTLETGVPISTSDQTAKTTLYFTPYKGNHIGLFDGSALWTVLPFSELSLDISAYTANKNYDIWIYDNSGTAALDSTVWTNDTTRATALTTQNGIYVKTGATTRRYLGTIRITGTLGQCEDSLQYRYVWNYYNRVNRRQYKTDATSHSYTTSSYRAWNNTATNAIFFVLGVQEDAYAISVKHGFGAAAGTYAGATLDGAGSPSLESVIGNIGTSLYRVGITSNYAVGAGYHFFTAVEYGVASATFTEFSLAAAFIG